LPRAADRGYVGRDGMGQCGVLQYLDASNSCRGRSVKELEHIVSRIRTRWPEVQIVVRGDSVFAGNN
jgi:hypothetical protein